MSAAGPNAPEAVRIGSGIARLEAALTACYVEIDGLIAVIEGGDMAAVEAALMAGFPSLERLEKTAAGIDMAEVRSATGTRLDEALAAVRTHAQTIADYQAKIGIPAAARN